MAVHVDNTNFKSEVLESDQPVLVDFYATWCGPCKMIAPIIDQLSGEVEGKAKVFKVDVDQARDIASQYKIMSVPTLLFFKNGEVVDQVMGAVPKAQLETKLNALL